MTADEAAVAVIEALDRARIPFMIVGSLASNFHGIPRATRDADFLIHVRNIIAVRSADLDWAYIERWCATHDTLGPLNDIRDSIPPA